MYFALWNYTSILSLLDLNHLRARMDLMVLVSLGHLDLWGRHPMQPPGGRFDQTWPNSSQLLRLPERSESLGDLYSRGRCLASQRG